LCEVCGDARVPKQSVFAPRLFVAKVVLSTDGRTGIGRCVSHELSLGSTVARVGRKPEMRQGVRDEIVSEGGLASLHVCDLRQEDAVKRIGADGIAPHGVINGLVNNAVRQFMTPLEAITAKGWEAVLDTNPTGGFYGTGALYAKHAQVGWRHRPSRRRHLGPMPGMGGSGAAHAGMVRLAETAALE
jgi:citronellol/citronellal dehydrogenase